MKKIINNAADFVDETIEGIIAAYGDYLKLNNGDKREIITNYPVKEKKVGIVTAGGSGHLPVFLGYVGQGMLDGCAVGNVFASPSASKIADVIKACDYGSGVLCLYGNYGGDSMNFEMARDAVEFDEDVKTFSIRVKDDIASASKESAEKRRGVAGMVYAFKIAGAAADMGFSLEEVAKVTQKALDNIRSIGLALSPCIVPEAGEPTFSIREDEVKIGMGIHGEPGIETSALMKADDLTDKLIFQLEQDMHLKAGDEVSVMINGLGATPKEELLIVYRRVHQILREQEITVYMPHIGEFATSMEMAGCSVTLFKLDGQMKELLRYPAKTPFYTNANI